MSFFDAIEDAFSGISDFMSDMGDPFGFNGDIIIHTDGPADISVHIEDDPTLGDDGWY